MSLAVKVRYILVRAARGDPHVKAREAVHTPREVRAPDASPAVVVVFERFTVGACVAHTPMRRSRAHERVYCMAHIFMELLHSSLASNRDGACAQRTSHSCGRPPAYPPTRRCLRCTGRAVRSAHSCRNASAGGTRASSSPRGDAMYHTRHAHGPCTHHAHTTQTCTCHAHTMHAPCTCRPHTIVHAMSHECNVSKKCVRCRACGKHAPQFMHQPRTIYAPFMLMP